MTGNVREDEFPNSQAVLGLSECDITRVTLRCLGLTFKRTLFLRSPALITSTSSLNRRFEGRLLTKGGVDRGIQRRRHQGCVACVASQPNHTLRHAQIDKVQVLKA